MNDNNAFIVLMSRSSFILGPESDSTVVYGWSTPPIHACGIGMHLHNAQYYYTALMLNIT